jgi:hypothetical protein
MSKYIPAEELRTTGILQEINRQFLHPLGLALDVLVDPKTGKATGLGGIQDHREASGGVIFSDDMLSKAKARKIREMRKKNLAERKKLFNGAVVQPIVE